jgi:hypothetical protein
MPKFVVSEEVEIVLDGERYLLEKGDLITIDEVRDISGILRRSEAVKAREDARIEAGRQARTFLHIEDRDREVLMKIIGELYQTKRPDQALQVRDVIQRYNEEYDPQEKRAGFKFDPDMIGSLIDEYERTMSTAMMR